MDYHPIELVWMLEYREECSYTYQYSFRLFKKGQGKVAHNDGSAEREEGGGGHV